jgi:hypothetical protein
LIFNINFILKMIFCGMWWLRWDVVAQVGCGGSVGKGDWMKQTATQQFWL